MVEENSYEATSNQIHDVFISFSSKDIDTARLVYDELEAREINCWLADSSRDDIPPGESWPEILTRELKNSRMVLLIFSEDSNISRHVQNEIGLAFNYKLEILPMRIQDEKPGDTLEYYLINTQWFDFFPPPPPIDKDKLEKLTYVVKRLKKGTKSLSKTIDGQSDRTVKVPFFSTWVIKPLFSWAQKFSKSIPALDGALWMFLIMFLVFFIPLAVSHRLVGDYPPQSLGEIFSLAPPSHYYYPDLNALLFDMLLHPAAFATLVYFVLFLNEKGNQYLSNAEAGFITTRKSRSTRFWINIVNFLIVIVLPIGMSLMAFLYRRQVYISYGMKEPLIFWASLAVALSIYAFVALSINSCYIALLVKPISDMEMQADDDRLFYSERAVMLGKLTIIFIYVILMLLIEILVEWMMADFNGAPLNDLIRGVVLFFGGIAIVVLVVKILWLFVPEIGANARSAGKALLKVNRNNLILLIVPAMLIILTISLWYQTH
jgi:hypothetical protein